MNVLMFLAHFGAQNLPKVWQKKYSTRSQDHVEEV